MELSDILNSLESGSGTSGSFEKTASASTDDLSMAIDRALGSSDFQKTASLVSSPADDLMKVASSLAEAETGALVKEANLYGAAVADGFMHRMNGFEKTAAAVDHSPQMIKQAYDKGYADTSAYLSSQVSGNVSADMVKQAAFEEGYGDTIKQAAFEEGYKDTVKQAAFEEGYKDTVKQAAFEKGFNDTVAESNELTKVAAAYEDYGFKYGNSILSKI